MWTCLRAPLSFAGFALMHLNPFGPAVGVLIESPSTRVAPSLTADCLLSGSSCSCRADGEGLGFVDI